jgi:hypothetical protein
MNRSERCRTGRFWKGVAQITRNLHQAFVASVCFILMFSISSIWRVDDCITTPARPLPRLVLDSSSTRSRIGQSERAEPRGNFRDWNRALLQRSCPLYWCCAGPGSDDLRQALIATAAIKAGAAAAGWGKPLFSRAGNAVSTFQRNSAHRA